MFDQKIEVLRVGILSKQNQMWCVSIGDSMVFGSIVGSDCYAMTHSSYEPDFILIASEIYTRRREYRR